MSNSDPIAVTLADIETALAAGSLWVAMNNGRWWNARRNGATKTWKTRPSEFHVPIKFGLRGTARLTETDAMRSFPSLFLISKIDPNNAKRR